MSGFGASVNDEIKTFPVSMATGIMMTLEVYDMTSQCRRI